MSKFLVGPASVFPVLAFEGDSISVWELKQLNFVGLTQTNKTPYFTSPVFATGGATISTLSARAATTDAAIVTARAPYNILTVFIGANDLTAGTSAASIFSQLKTYLSARRAAGWKVVASTMLPSNYLACASSGCEATRLSVNTSIRGDTSFYDALADIGDTATTMGNISNNSNITYYTQPDGVHPQEPDGHNLLAPYFETAIGTLLP